MSGDNTADTTTNMAPDAATQQVLAQLNAKFAQDASQPQPAPVDNTQGRAGYGVAPAALNGLGEKPKSSDPYVNSHTITGRAGYGVSGTLAPGGAGVAPNKPGGEVVPNFQQLHADQARDPRQPYTPNPMGAQAAQQMGGQGGPGGNDARIMADIAKRGQYVSGWTWAFGGLGSVTAPLTAKVLSTGADAL